MDTGVECTGRVGGLQGWAIAWVHRAPRLDHLTPTLPRRLLPCSHKMDGPYDSRILPVVLTVIMMTFLTVVWIGSIVSFEEGA